MRMCTYMHLYYCPKRYCIIVLLYYFIIVLLYDLYGCIIAFCSIYHLFCTLYGASYTMHHALCILHSVSVFVHVTVHTHTYIYICMYMTMNMHMHSHTPILESLGHVGDFQWLVPGATEIRTMARRALIHSKAGCCSDDEAVAVAQWLIVCWG